MTKAKIDIPKHLLDDFCKRHHIIKLALFGSVIRKDFDFKSDVDVMVEFKSDVRVGLIRFAGMELELSKIIGRRVDLNTPDFISKYYREKVLADMEVQYDAA